MSRDSGPGVSYCSVHVPYIPYLVQRTLYIDTKRSNKQGIKGVSICMAEIAIPSPACDSCTLQDNLFCFGNTGVHAGIRYEHILSTALLSTFSFS